MNPHDRLHKSCNHQAPLQRSYLGVKISAFIGLLMIAAHDIVYRQTGGEDFELGFISHAGADMLFLVLIPILIVLTLIESEK